MTGEQIDRFISITERMITAAQKQFEKAHETGNWARMAEIEAYKNGLEQAIENYNQTMDNRT